MISLPPSVRIFLAVQPADMRRGFDGLAALTTSVIGQDPLSGHLFVFHNRRRDRIKILGWDGSGFWLMMKRLEASRFIWPDNKAEVVTMTTNVLHALLDGDDITTIRRHPKQEYLRVS